MLVLFLYIIYIHKTRGWMIPIVCTKRLKEGFIGIGGDIKEFNGANYMERFENIPTPIVVHILIRAARNIFHVMVLLLQKRSAISPSRSLA